MHEISTLVSQALFLQGCSFSQASFIQATAQKSGLTFESLFIRTIKFGRCGRLQIRSGDMSLPKIQKQKSQPFMITVP